jgi:hypothetical protein
MLTEAKTGTERSIAAVNAREELCGLTVSGSVTGAGRELLNWQQGGTSPECTLVRDAVAAAMRAIMRQHAWPGMEPEAGAHAANARNGTSSTVTKAPAATSLRHNSIANNYR